ncbi:hypothetical protein HU200_023950 [Digitaria exilis]|uniref:folate gamma-glutamyl hydrolase n=1 Tax=Digitaria exilis TaxID=1010633 RepID=A0A835EVQ6_9POAL|nr:hypothetical protein HU200_023950 [Digitaria exilis]CAB3460971.1 unnamed protein product [Digitaria exilis]
MDSARAPHLIFLLCLLLVSLLAPPPGGAAAAPGFIRLPSAAGKAGARACGAQPDPAAYDRPVIGIVSHPGDGAGGRISNGTATSYIGASYVKFVEAAGARVIPLVYNEPEERLLEKLSLVNGVLFTGGSEKQGVYFETIKKVFQYVLDKNDAGEPFPLFAQCLGFELVSMIVSKDNNILETFDAQNQASTLQFPSYSFEGTVFQRFDPDLIKKVSTSCLVMQNHMYGISPKRLRDNGELSSFFRILTTSPDENGKVYVSTVQANKYPITCTQWHPEKAIFEWRKPMIPHSEDAVQVTQHFANHFISQARKSPNRPPADKVLDNLIYNYNPTFSGKISKSFEEVYIFS